MNGIQQVQEGKGYIYLESVDLKMARWEHFCPKAKLTAERKNISLEGINYSHGVGMHARSVLSIDLKGMATQFTAVVGIDDARPLSGAAIFEVWLNDRKVYDSGVMRSAQGVQYLSISLKDARKMALRANSVNSNNGNALVDWADAKIWLDHNCIELPQAIPSDPLLPEEAPVGGLEIEPLPSICIIDKTALAINSPRVVGATPGRPFLFRVPASGRGALRYKVENLPEGLMSNPETGIIFGALKHAGETTVHITVEDSTGEAQSDLSIIGGENKNALTPPMGWNTWYVLGGRIDDQAIRRAAELLVETDLAAKGYNYVNLDDCWQGERDANGYIQPNRKFPDMKALGDHIHSLGLKFGMYSSPGVKTCAGFTGSFGHEKQDADSYAHWGVDLLKYDLCSYYKGDSWALIDDYPIEEMKRPLVIMKEALEATGRDIVFSPGGWPRIWKWGADVGLHMWRIANDITPCWSDLKRMIDTQRGIEQYAKPGCWNDPDMLMIGPSWFGKDWPSMLTGNEQVLHMTHWCLSAAPLLISCNLEKIDDFSLSLLGNPEAIEVDQDALGIQAMPVFYDKDIEVLAKPLCDGAIAVGLFNWGHETRDVTARWADLNIKGAKSVRDIWHRRDLGSFDESYSATIPSHGSVFLKIADITV